MVRCVGTVDDAIRISKAARNVLFFVFEEGSEEGGMDLLRNLSVSLILESPAFVGVRVSTSSELFNQFSAIYHFISVPCLFFMRHDGQPIDVIGNDVSPEDAYNRIQACMSYADHSQNSTDEAYYSNTPRPENASESPEPADMLGKEMSNMKKHCLSPEKIERSQDSTLKDQPPVPKKRKGDTSSSLGESSSTQIHSTTAHVQFRLPTGDTHLHLFPENATVLDIFKYVEDHLVLPLGRWSLSLSYPRRELSLAEGMKTLLEVGLVPNGVVLIIPASGEVSRQSIFQVAGNLLYSILQTPISAVNSIYSYVYSFLFGDSDDSDQNSSVDSQDADSSAQPSQFIINQTLRRRTPTTSVLRDGNIHRLTFRQDESEDENNTWNGNSTQQM